MGITSHEVRAVRTLMPFFSKEPVVIDIGSNKGEWADILIRNVKEMHLFEPNELLLHYTMVKYDDLSNVFYWKYAAFSKEETRPFWYFTNQNNGLSSVFYNQKWVDMGLPMQEGKCHARRLDSLFDKPIDFIKIDAEGADLDVLLGCDNLLKNKLVKFIQIEYSEHYKLAGHEFNEVIPFVRQYGYDVFHFDNSLFHRIGKTDPKEFGAENFYIMDKDFTQDWNSEFKYNTQGMKFNFALEIGCFEGLTTNYICDNLLNEGGRIICIDPLNDYYTEWSDELTDQMFKGQYERFMRNTAGKPVELIRMNSRQAFDISGFNAYRFDFIYIDGDHSENEVYLDGKQSFYLLKQYGHILFDDYGWREETAKGIERFLNEFKKDIEVVRKGYQVLVRKLTIT